MTLTFDGGKNHSIHTCNYKLYLNVLYEILVVQCNDQSIALKNDKSKCCLKHTGLNIPVQVYGCVSNDHQQASENLTEICAL